VELVVVVIVLVVLMVVKGVNESRILVVEFNKLGLGLRSNLAWM